MMLRRAFNAAVGAVPNAVGRVLEEVEGHQGFEGRPVAAFWPASIEVTEADDMSGG
jgi:hypothetical protein